MEKVMSVYVISYWTDTNKPICVDKSFAVNRKECDRACEKWNKKDFFNYTTVEKLRRT